MKREETLSSFEFHEIIPDEAAAIAFFEAARWPEGRFCPHCGSFNTVEVSTGKPQPYRCKDCRKHFSYRTKTPMQASKLPVKKWLFAMYLMSVSKKGLSSLQLGRSLGIAPEAAWRLGHKIREGWNRDALFPMAGAVEIDEVYIGGKRKNMHAKKRKQLTGRGAVGKQPVMGIRERGTGRVEAFPIDSTEAATMQPEIRARVEPGTMLYTDGHKSYQGMREYRLESVAHHAGEYVRDQAHTNGMESFWALLKRGYVGTYHHFSVKHLSRYVDEFCHRQNNRGLHALDFMRQTSESFEGRVLTHRQLVDGDGA